LGTQVNLPPGREIPEEFAAEVDRSNQFPSEMWKKMGSAGFLGITAEEDFGGLDMGYQAHCVVMEELSRASASIGLSYAAHSQLCINQLTLHGTKEQKERWLPGLVSGELVGALAMSEHSAGSDVVSMRSGLRKTEAGGWVLNGTKMWITNVRRCFLTGLPSVYMLGVYRRLTFHTLHRDRMRTSLWCTPNPHRTPARRG